MISEVFLRFLIVSHICIWFRIELLASDIELQQGQGCASPGPTVVVVVVPRVSAGGLAWNLITDRPGREFINFHLRRISTPRVLQSTEIYPNRKNCAWHWKCINKTEEALRSKQAKVLKQSRTTDPLRSKLNNVLLPWELL